ncbi:MAG: hypothetical protein LBR76_03830 [Oscillospiraceae bacterium]|nr:hypothetical protein [Oscillospiraceae bacterium]
MTRKVFAVLLLLPLLGGCWDYKDLDRLSIVTGMAVDSAPGGRVLVTLETVSSSEGTVKARLVRGEGRTAEAAVREAKKQLERELYFGNMSIVVFGESVGIHAPVEWLKSVRGIRETVYIAAASACAGELFDTEEGAFQLRDMLDASETVKPAELYRFGNTLPLFALTEGKHPALTGIVPVSGTGS